MDCNRIHKFLGVSPLEYLYVLQIEIKSCLSVLGGFYSKGSCAGPQKGPLAMSRVSRSGQIYKFRKSWLVKLGPENVGPEFVDREARLVIIPNLNLA